MMKEIYPMDLGSFQLFDSVGKLVIPIKTIQEFFNSPFWKTYYIGESSDERGLKDFQVVDKRTGKVIPLKIKLLSV